MRPGTASSGTAMVRPPTASNGMLRLPTAASASGGLVAGALHGVVPDRPVTQQGLAGLPVHPGTAAGGGRAVLDVSYLVGMLRNRINEVAAETQRLRAETERANRDVAATSGYERQLSTLSTEVRSLEGDLADFNLALDKTRAHADVADVTAAVAAAARRNEVATREADRLFVQRTEHERSTAAMEQTIAELQRAAVARIRTLPPEQIQEYDALVAENAALAAEASRAQSELEVLGAQIEAADAELRNDRIRDEYASQQKRLASLQHEKAELEEDLQICRLDPADARDRILARVKADNAKVQAADRRIEELTAEAESKRRTASEVAAEVEERRGHAGDASKYEALFQRDQEMTEFIDQFDEHRAREAEEQQRLQASIRELEERIAACESKRKALPQQAEDLKSEQADKAQLHELSQLPVEQLRDELAAKHAELQKVTELEGRIEAELRRMRERTQEMQSELVTFADIAGLRAAAEKSKAQLVSLVQEYNVQLDSYKPVIAARTAELERSRAALLANPQAVALAAFEAKLKLSEQNVHQLREFVVAKTREGDYAGLKTNVLQVTGEINLLLQRGCSSSAANNTNFGGVTASVNNNHAVGIGNKKTMVLNA